MSDTAKNTFRRIGGGVIEIDLKSNGGICLVDEADHPIVANLNWFAKTGKRGGTYVTARAGRADGRKSLMMHRLILNAVPGDVVDHINRNTLDNRRENIRVCSTSENVQRALRKVAVSGFWGVRKSGLKYYVTVRNKRVTVWFSSHETAEEAARQYDRVVTEIYGPLARTNQSAGLL